MVKNIFLVTVKNNVLLYSKQKYNELGQLRGKKLHGGIQEVNYTYNIRGWLTEINKTEDLAGDLFAMQLDYNTADHEQFNGNIGAISWKSNYYNELKTYDFTYDGLNRILTANYDNSGFYNTAYSYDANGNIKTLNRHMNINNVAEPIDQLVYDYGVTGNQLLSVDDAIGSNYESFGFKDNGSFSQEEYGYDDNGNMITDLNKGIINITYNYLNLPTNIFFSNNKTENKQIGYIYTATGNKLRKHTHDGSKESVTTDYLGAFIYKNDEISFIQTSEGRLVPNDNREFNYEYALKDHLGNTRVMFSQSGEILQDESYYPFGMSLGDALTYNGSNSPENKYLYNGKEKQSDFGLDWYDYGARFYDPAIGRWHVADPLAEKAFNLTPYRYAFNNPISFIDPDGMAERSGMLDREMELDDEYTIDKNTRTTTKISNLGDDEGIDFYFVGESRDNGTAFVVDQFFTVDRNADGGNINTFRIQDGSAGGGGLPAIDGMIGPWSVETITNAYNTGLMYLDGTNQSTGFVVSLASVALENSKYIANVAEGTFWVGLGISALRTDCENTQSVIEFGIGTGVSGGAYFYPWAIPFAGVYSAISIDKEYSKTLPERAAKGYKSSNQQIMRHPYFRNLD